MAPAWSSRASCGLAPCQAHRPPWPTSWDCATWPSRSTTCRRLWIGQLPRATDWSVASASTRALGGWPTSGGRKGSSSHWPSASAERRNARICHNPRSDVAAQLADDWAGSTGVRKELGELLAWFHESERLARSAVEARRDAGQVLG